MMAMLPENPYFQNVASDFVSLTILSVFGLGLFWLTRRRALARFFGINDKRRVVIYLSRLAITRGGAIGIDGIPRSFGAIAVPEYEANLMPALRGLFAGVRPGGDAVPGVLGRLVYDDIKVDFRASPPATDAVEASTPFITLGSTGYNAASIWVEESMPNGASFDPRTGRVVQPGLGAVGDGSTGFVQRVRDRTTGHVAIYVAGSSALATTGAVRFLIDRWKYLRKQFGDSESFCVVLNFATLDARSPEIVSETTLS